MHGHKMLKQVQKVEHVGCMSRRLSMLLAFMVLKTFVNTAKTSCCDRRTVAMWHCRFACATKSFHGIRQALSDKPRSGRPPKIDRKILNKARHWCEERAFTPVETARQTRRDVWKKPWHLADKAICQTVGAL